MVAGAVVFAAFLVACGGGSSKNSGGPTVAVSLTSDGCDPASISAASGKTTFKVTNKGANGVTEFEILDGNHVIGEVENVVPGLTRSFNIDLQPGTFTTSCPGGSKTPKGTLTVTGAAAAPTGPSGPTTSVDVVEKDFAIAPSAASGPAGNYTFNITNQGPTAHEFVIIKTDVKADQLPVQGDEVNEDDPKLQRIDEVEDLQQGGTSSFTVNLEAGHYAFICNIAAHYGQGMHVDFEVKSAG